jgi:hypothetical protein
VSVVNVYGVMKSWTSQEEEADAVNQNRYLPSPQNAIGRYWAVSFDCAMSGAEQSLVQQWGEVLSMSVLDVTNGFGPLMVPVREDLEQHAGNASSEDAM